MKKIREPNISAVLDEIAARRPDLVPFLLALSHDDGVPVSATTARQTDAVNKLFARLVTANVSPIRWWLATTPRRILRTILR